MCGLRCCNRTVDQTISCSWKTWKDQKALDAHGMATHTDNCATSSTSGVSPFDERLHKGLAISAARPHVPQEPRMS